VLTICVCPSHQLAPIAKDDEMVAVGGANGGLRLPGGWRRINLGVPPGKEMKKESTSLSEFSCVRVE